MWKRFFVTMCMVLTIGIGGGFAAEIDNSANGNALFPLLPANTVAAVRLVSIEKGALDLNSFLLPAAGLPMGGEIEKGIQELLNLKSLEGIDREKPIWLFVGLDEERDPVLSMMLPLTDREKVIADSGLEKQETGEYEGDDRSALFLEKCALFCEDSISESHRNWFSEASIQKVAEFSGDSVSDLSLWIHIAPLNPILQDLSNDMMQNMQGIMAMNPMMSPSMIPMLQKECGWILDLMDQVEMVHVDLRFSSESLTIQKRSILKEGTPLAEFFSTATYPDPSGVLSIMKPDNLLSMVLNLDPKVYQMAMDRMIKDFGDLDFDVTAMREIMEGAMKIYRGPIGMSLYVSTDPQKPVAFSELVEVNNAAKAGELMSRMSGMMQASASMVVPATGIRMEIKEEPNIGTYKKIAYSKIAMRYKVDDPESPLVEILAKQNLDYFYAVTDKLMILSSGDMPDVLEQVLSDQGNPDQTLIKKNSMMGMRLNLLQGLKVAKQQLAQTMAGVNPLQMVEIPDNAENPGITADLHMEGNVPVSTLIVPVKEVAAVREAMMGAMMKQAGNANQ